MVKNFMSITINLALYFDIVENIIARHCQAVASPTPRCPLVFFFFFDHAMLLVAFILGSQKYPCT